MVDTPSFLTYASVVSRETVRIALTIAALHDLDVKAADVENAYLTAPTTEKVWTVCGPEFGPEEGSYCQSSLWTERQWCILSQSYF